MAIGLPMCLLMGALLLAPPAHAAKKSTTECAGVETSIIKCKGNNDSKNIEDNGVWQLLLMVINILTAGVGVVAVGGIVYGAILYASAEAKSDQVRQAKTIISNVAIGLVLFALMWAMLNFLVPGGVFS